MVSVLVEGDLIKLLKNIEVERSHQNIKGKFNNERWEIDILAVNGQKI